ncbi:MAG: hypothetical protein ABIK68_19375 [bacterium]
MRGKLLRRLWLIAGLFVGLSLVSVEAADIVSKPGLYQDKTVGFSLTWPASVFTGTDKLASEAEVVRVLPEGQTLPVLTISVYDKTKETVALEKAGESFKDGLEKSQAGAKRFKLREDKMITLAGGVQANYAMVTWKWGGTYALVTVGVTAFKGDKVIIVSCTSAPGQPAVEVLDKWVMALQIDP